MRSLWIDSVKMPRFEPLRGDLRTDVLIIGGGMAGLLCAHMLSRAGVDYALVEAQRLCGGITMNTTAKISSQHGLIYEKLLREFGAEKARLYLEINENAIGQFRALCSGIDCDFEERSSFVYSMNDRRKLEKELAALHAIGYEAEFMDRLQLPFLTAGAVCFKNQAQFNPMKFAAEIARGLRIYEHTKVRELMPGKAITENGEISAGKIIVATHFPILNKHGGYFLKLYQHRSYVLALKNAPEIRAMFVDEAKTGLSMRSYGDLLLLGGGSHRTGKKGGGWREVEKFAKEYFPGSEVVSRWATQDCMSLDGVPYIGRYSRGTPEMFVASGFNKWGMTSSMAAATILADLVQGRDNPYAEVFDPSRSILRPQLAVNGAETILSWLTPTAPRCPHMGCALKFNRAERSWDCPCHGSRFDKSGKLIDNPATDDKSF